MFRCWLYSILNPKNTWIPAVSGSQLRNIQPTPKKALEMMFWMVFSMFFPQVMPIFSTIHLGFSSKNFSTSQRFGSHAFSAGPRFPSSSAGVSPARPSPRRSAAAGGGQVGVPKAGSIHGGWEESTDCWVICGSYPDVFIILWVVIYSSLYQLLSNSWSYGWISSFHQFVQYFMVWFWWFHVCDHKFLELEIHNSQLFWLEAQGLWSRVMYEASLSFALIREKNGEFGTYYEGPPDFLMQKQVSHITIGILTSFSFSNWQRVAAHSFPSWMFCVLTFCT